MLADCTSVSDWRSSTKTPSFGLERNQSATVKISDAYVRKSVFFAAGGGLISNTSTRDFLYKIIWSSICT